MDNASTESIELTTKPDISFSGHKRLVRAIQFFPEGGQLVSCSYDRTIRLWNFTASTAGETKTISDIREVNCLTISPDGKRIISGGDDGLLKIWDRKTQALLGKWKGQGKWIICVSISPNGKFVASGDRGGEVLMWDSTNGDILWRMGEYHCGPIYRIFSVVFSPSSSKLAIAEEDGRIRVVGVETAELILGPIKAHEDGIYSIAWSVDEKWLYSGSADGIIRKWDAETGDEVGEPFRGHTSTVAALAISSDGNTIASASHDKTVRFWRAESGQPVGEPLQHDVSVLAIAFSPIGEFLASGGGDGKVNVWHVPWWDGHGEHNRLVTSSGFLDLPAIARSLPSDDYRGDILDVSAIYGPSSHHPIRSGKPRQHLEHPNTGPSQSQYLRDWWKTPARLFRRRLLGGCNHKSPQQAVITPVSAGHAEPRVWVACDDERQTLPQPLPAAPGYYQFFSILTKSQESVCRSSSPVVSSDADVTGHQHGTGSLFCCGLWAGSGLIFRRQRSRPRKSSLEVPAVHYAEDSRTPNAGPGSQRASPRDASVYGPNMLAPPEAASDSASLASSRSFHSARSNIGGSDVDQHPELEGWA
ncbi:hypothetical protein HYDPIDRAFT_112883 [Hydnomerulius pinastri MD-312]|uniref:Unplaced genomic scaffold scaffold_16, whole genome shotgun sequence n=1 Tax=Hydnomerulius pinastri MD-312 TaxID=994086 RepID=A0A0C9VYM3_9AGAM|nr:hypothetical protein HYDPIDRAFT_112883 [Hydnomerulius pinastri MD-312]